MISTESSHRLGKQSIWMIVLLLACVNLYAGQERVLLLGPMVGTHGNGANLSYYSWGSGQKGWIVASTYTVTALLPQGESLETPNDLMGALGFGLTFLRRSISGFSPALGFGMNWGTEEVDNSYRNFFMGINIHEGVMWIPRGVFGVVPSIGLYQGYNINSELCPWNSAAYAMVGIKF